MSQKNNCFGLLLGLILILIPALAFGQFRVENESRSNLNILFNNPDYQIKQEMIGNTEYDYVSSQVPTVTIEVGAPELPFYSSTIEIPNTGKPTIELRVVESELIKDIKIKPFRGSELKAITFDNSVYTKDIYYPINRVQIGEPAILRNKRLVSFVVNPFRYNDASNTLEVITKAEILITIEDQPSVNEITRSFMKTDRSFENFFASTVLNYKEVKSRDDYQNPTILYIYASGLESSSALEDLFNWRREQGWTVYSASTNVTGYDDQDIKSYIHNAYLNWENPPAYVTFIGDTSGMFIIPTSFLPYNFDSEHPEDIAGGDHYYALLDGNDELEDIFIGRISINTSNELDVIVSKTIQYEKATVTLDPSYYTKALLVGKTERSGESTVITNLYIKEIMNDYNEDSSFIEHYGYWITPSLITDALNLGVGFWNYRGLEGMDGWNNSQISSLSNIDKLTIALILTANTGSFYDGSSRTEEIVKAGSVTEPTGAVCAVGLASGVTHTTFTNCLDGGIMGYLFSEGGWTMGAAVNRGKHYLWQAYGSSNFNMYLLHSTVCNLMGDSALRVYKASPKFFQTDCLENVALGSNQYKVKTHENNLALDDVWATLKIADDYFTAYTDFHGEVFFDIPENVQGQGLLTLSKEGYQPQQYDINFGLEGPSLNATATTLFHGASEVEYASPGMTYSLKIEVTNAGSADVTDISGRIIANTNGLAVTTNQVVYGDIMSSQSTENSDCFEFLVANRAFENDIALKIILSNDSYSWERQILIPTQSPIIEVLDYTLSNTDFYQREVSQLNVQLVNLGSADLISANATLTSLDSRLTVNSPLVHIGNMPSGANTTMTFSVIASSDFIPGELVPMLVNINDSGFETECYFNLQIGQASITDPLGPDAYGYYIFDSYDTEYEDCPVYDWIELDPELGGDGQAIASLLQDNGNDSQQVVTLALPFTFKFYGRDYDQISLCSNGWVAMGQTEQTTFRNWRLPGPLGPSPMITPFWDNLYAIASSQVFISYDETENCFVITWDDWRIFHYDSAEETFQVILYDPEFHNSSTEDGPIKIQYKVVNNVDFGVDYQHGQYTTVGIEDHTARVGLEYTYNNQYPQAARPLENELALFITTKIGQLPPLVITQPNDIIFEEDSSDNTINLFNIFRDPNNDDIEFTFSDTENLFFEVDEAGYLTITSVQDWNGFETVTISANDGINDYSAEVSFLLTVTPVDDRPYLVAKIPENTNFDSNTNHINFSVSVIDIDSALSYKWKINNEELENQVTDTLNYVFPNVGEYSVKCYAITTDSDVSVVVSWNVNVAVANDVEVLFVNSLSQNNPNPFNPTTNINFSLNKSSDVSIIIYNVKGQKVRTLVSDKYSQGIHNVVWNGLDDNNQVVSSGIYLYRMVIDDFICTKKAIMLK